MTNFAVQATLGPVISSVASKEKGSMGNRMDCAGAQLKNGVVTGLEAGAVIGGAAGAKYAVHHSDKLAATITKAGKTVAKAYENLICKIKGQPIAQKATVTAEKLVKNVKTGALYQNAEKIAENLKNSKLGKFAKRKLAYAENQTKGFHTGLKENLEKLTKFTNKQKASKLIAIIAAPVLAFVVGKGLYKMGQIDQKYTDKAQLQKTL